MRHYSIKMIHGLTTFTCPRCKHSVTTSEFSSQTAASEPKQARAMNQHAVTEHSGPDPLRPCIRGVARSLNAHQHKVNKREKMKILLIKTVNSSGLQMNGYLLRLGTVLSKPEGEDLRVARKDIPDLILLDMMLPKVSGLDVLRALKGDVLVKHIPVIVLSGLGQGNETKLLKEGAAAFFMKSEKSLENSSSALIQAVENVLDAAKASEAISAQ